MNQRSPHNFGGVNNPAFPQIHISAIRCVEASLNIALLQQFGGNQVSFVACVFSDEDCWNFDCVLDDADA